MAQFYKPDRPISGVTIKSEIFRPPFYKRDDSSLRRLIDATKLAQSNFALLLQKKSKVNIKDLNEVALEAEELTFRLQIAAKLCTEIDHITDVLDNSLVEYYEARRLKKQVRWLNSRLENLFASFENYHFVKNFEQLSRKSTNLSLKSVKSRNSDKDSFLNTENMENASPSPIGFKRKPSSMPPATTYGDDESDEEVAASMYWKEPHHRYYYNPNSISMYKADPLTLHQMGLAVCDSYCEQAVENCPLPWRSSKKNKIKYGDFEKKALNLLKDKIYKFNEKINAAAELACDGYFHDHVSTDTKFVDIEEALFARTPSVRVSIMSRPTTQYSDLLERLQKKLLRMGSSIGDTITFNTENLPPLSLPIKNFSHAYPQEPTVWNSLDLKNFKNPPSFAHQHGLYNETMLSLFKARSKHHALRSAKTLSIPDFFGEKMTKWSVLNQVQEFNPLPVDRIQLERFQECVKWLSSEKEFQVQQAIMCLQSFKCRDSFAFSKLEEICLNNAFKTETRAMSALASISLGNWSSIVLKTISEMLNQVEDKETTVKILKTLLSTSNLIDILQVEGTDGILHCLKTLLTKKQNSFPVILNACLLCGSLDILQNVVIRKLIGFLSEIRASAFHAQILEVLTKYLHCYDLVVCNKLTEQIFNASNFKHRGNALCIILCIGVEQLIQNGLKEEVIFDLLTEKISKDSLKDVRYLAAEVMSSFKMKQRALVICQQKLESENEDERLNAVRAAASLGLKKESALKLLVEMLDIDPSEYIRLEIMRTLGELGVTNSKILRTLKSKEMQGGTFGREAKKVLDKLCQI